ncbi:MAG TPA: type IV toxin-antitoxin system AbiEi family antitoxin domain-containing protein [Solirubrobacteraceae bacterium]|nr:type IV toxin-antitoxin system AbiEi family antitoxin domain-containing protein [Solirubrobacteraceae bacterium]
MRRQAGAITAGQLKGLGLTDRNVARLLTQGTLVRRYRGVYIDGCVAPTQRTELWAAQLAAGPDAFFSHRTTAALLGLRPVNIRALELTVVRSHTPTIAGLRVHRTTYPPTRSELRVTDGLRHSAYTRMLIELSPRETAAELDRLIAEGARRRLLDLDRLDAALTRRRRVPGRAALERALARYRPAPGDVSTLERDFAAWLATLPDIPPPQRNVHLADRWEVDFYWPAQRLVVETDGSLFHRTPDELERDRLKDTWLQRHAIRAMRVSDFRFAHDRTGIHDDLRALLALAA